jgi:CD109 antigen
VKTQPNSYVGLLGVDQSVLLLKKGNDIDHSSVFSELSEYSRPTRYNYEWYEGYDYNRRHSDFDSYDTILITNAKKEYGNKLN